LKNKNHGFGLVVISSSCFFSQLSQGFHYLENQGKSENFELSGMPGNCWGIFLPVTELMGKQVHFYASGLQTCPAH
jgi:hypothetical protein